MTSPALQFLFYALALALMALVAFLVYAAVRYSPIIGRIFEEQPLLLPLRVSPRDDGEEVRFATTDGLTLAGSYFRARTPTRTGVLVFCHEYLSDRWSFEPYVDSLRDHGFDLFSFDFRNHGVSASADGYGPLQWVSDYEVNDLRAALDYLRSRPDRDLAGCGLFGVSRGGGTALVVAADDPRVWGVVTDGAFPTDGTMTSYIVRWAEIYVQTEWLRRRLPMWFFRFVGWTGRLWSQKRLNCRFPNVERAAARLAPRPWLMIHGAKDAYIVPEIARGLFAVAGEPKEMWIVPDAKHNRCRELEPEGYAQRIADFCRRYAPRRSRRPVPEPAITAPRPLDVAVRHPILGAASPSSSTITGGLTAPLSG